MRQVRYFLFLVAAFGLLAGAAHGYYGAWTALAAGVPPPPPPVVLTPTAGSTLFTPMPSYVGTAASATVVATISTVMVVVDGTTQGSTTPDAFGNWTFVQPLGLADGPHVLTAYSIDNFGNLGNFSAPRSFTLDRTLPVPPTFTTPAHGAAYAYNQFDFNGLSEAGTEVVIVLDDTVAGAATADIGGNLDFSSPTLSDGVHTVFGRITHGGGTVVTGPANTFTIDTQAPATPAITAPVAGSTVTDPALVYAGTAEPLATMLLYVDGAFQNSGPADSLGRWSVGQAVLLSEGAHTAQVVARDAAGNESVFSPTVAFTLNLPLPAPVITSPLTGSYTTSNLPTYTGTAVGGLRVSLFVDGVLLQTTADVSGNWTIYTPGALLLAEGVHTAYAIASDALGEASPPSDTVTFTVDYTSPAPPNILVPAFGAALNTSAPTYAGTAEAGVEVTVFVDGADVGNTVGTTTTDATGNWSLAPGTPLPDGAHTVQAVTTDATGNTGNLSFITTFTLDTRAPSVVLSSPAGAATSTSPIVVDVAFSEPVTGFSGASVTVGNGTVTSVAGTDANYQLEIVPTADGAVTVALPAGQAFDGAGNANRAAVPLTVIYTAPPATFTVWTGTVSTDWFAADNWDNGVPTARLDARLPAGARRYPSLDGGAAEVRALTIDGGASLSMGSSFLSINGATLQVGGNFRSDGTFAATGGTVALVGPADSTGNSTGSTFQGISGTTPIHFHNLTIGAANAVLYVPITIGRVLLLNGNLGTAGQICTLAADAAQSAMVVNAGGAVLGAVTVECHQSAAAYAGLGYHFLSAPVQQAPVGDLATGGFTPIVNAAYNALPVPRLPAATFPNVFGYDETRGGAGNATFGVGYFSPTALTDLLTVGRGYTVYLRGGLTPDFVGELTTGDQTLTGLTRTGNNLGSIAKAGWHLLGNPFPSPLDWDLVRVPSGMSQSISVFKSTGPNQAGVYLTRVSTGDGTGIGTLPNGLLALGQGFFGRVTGLRPVDFTLPQSARPTTFVGATHYRAPSAARSAAAPSQVQLTLRAAAEPNAEAEGTTLCYFAPAATTHPDDALDGAAPAHNIGVPTLLTLAASTGDELAVNALPAAALTTGTTIELLLDLPTASAHTLAATALTNLAGTSVVLLDRLTATRYDLHQHATVTFTAAQPGEVRGRFALEIGGRVLGAVEVAPASVASFTLFPNPAHGTVSLTAPTAATFELFDALGRVVRVAPVSAGITSLSLVGLTPGVYTARQRGTVIGAQRLVVE